MAREFTGPITERSEAKSEQFRITFDTHLKIAVCSFDKVAMLKLSPSPLTHTLAATRRNLIRVLENHCHVHTAKQEEILNLVLL